ncbi:LOW QUALITY PROTEIN: inter-alpha-trypsin inhibitor heavy chain H5 [Cottoperca gobio]|uniref:LOW QUALITY PROTEIN: inter-alpha-trypsin inhibitor heavy chain H5 n=1 Tax=Cottoperca gobio TaxID=56716 RepID=A0A6J2S7M7_COTGO|nr:LOW QUALITY PROTEIN: inter-alpha-trypsin inhibitor heavy chain H5 [Cottoperca gobio]
MLLLTLLITCFSPSVLGQLGGFGDDIDSDLADFDLDIAPRRVPRQVKTILTKETKPHIQELSIKTTIISRYAFTAVYCAMLNRHSAAAEGVFHFQIPAGAYVSNFTMIIGGRVYQSEVRPKAKRVKQENGKARNKESGDASPEPEAEVFRMAASIPGRNRAVFLLTYEELLQRRLGRYEHVTSLRPLQLVSRLSLDVTIVDHSPITDLQVLPLRNGRSSGPNAAKTPAKLDPPVTTAVKNEKNVCKITFNPNIVQQAKITTNGILGDFVIRYDVQREMGIGDIQVLNGHFVHYFAPKDLPVVPKNVVFVIDTSASMLGTKIRQTKDALFTILRDLRPGDRFNFISFSNRIKVWQPNRLVPVTPLNIRDAKKFIYMLVPTGRTNIDGGIQTGSSLLREYLSSPDASPNSVSLIIFLTDGRPTVGETKSTAILGNTRSAVQEKFCIFTIGMGNDVDYRLLERMALENCGMMRRIHEDADASAMLKGFYDEIGTPLLSDIRINYTEDSVQYVTQHLFPNYFNGSEIVIAGKLTNLSVESLHVQITASNNDKSIVLETDVPLRHRQIETEKHVKAATAAMASGAKTPGSEVTQGLGVALGAIAEDFVERVWGFLSVKDGLKSRLRSQTSKDREDHIKQVTNVSLTYHFLTPLTNLVVEKPEVLADGTMAPAPTIPPSAGEAANELPGDAEDGNPQKANKKPGSQTSSTGNKIGKVERRPAKKSVTISKTSADGDPHFVVEFPLSKLTVCFNINGEPGHILRLVSDHKHSGVTVNGKLIGAPAPPGSHKQQRTYFSTVTIVVDRPRRAYIEVTPKKVILDGLDRMVLPCHSTVTVDSGALSVSIVGKSNVTVTVGGNIVFVILLHQYKNPAPYQRDHLGFYIGDSKGLSHNCHGLLGQFLYEEVGLAELPAQADMKPSSVLKVKERSVPVVQKSRKIYSGTQSVDCWFARNNAAKLIDGQYEDYLMSHMFDTGDWPHGTNGV